MRYIKFKYGMLFISAVCSLFILGAGMPYEYPDNSEKFFKPAENLIISNYKHGYEEYSHAKLNIREKTLFKDIGKVETRLNKDFNITAATYSPHIHPNRQVYFLATVKETKNDIRLHYIVLDAESNKVLLERTSYREKKV
jgi:hypothetical protein